MRPLMRPIATASDSNFSAIPISTNYTNNTQIRNISSTPLTEAQEIVIQWAKLCCSLQMSTHRRIYNSSGTGMSTIKTGGG